MELPALCPRCRQGPDLHRILINGTATPVFVCFECDATYEKEEDIANLRFHDFDQWAEAKGLVDKKDDYLIMDRKE
jgi:hypothetical protein